MSQDPFPFQIEAIESLGFIKHEKWNCFRKNHNHGRILQFGITNRLTALTVFFDSFQLETYDLEQEYAEAPSRTNYHISIILAHNMNDNLIKNQYSSFLNHLINDAEIINGAVYGDPYLSMYIHLPEETIYLVFGDSSGNYRVSSNATKAAYISNIRGFIFGD